MILNTVSHTCIEGAPDNEHADADHAEDAVAPERIGNHSWTAEFLLTSNPEDERGKEGDTEDECGECSRLFYFLCLLGYYAEGR